MTPGVSLDQAPIPPPGYHRAAAQGLHLDALLLVRRLQLLELLPTLWRLSYQEMHDWLVAWPALALACGLPIGTDGQLPAACAQ